jgi:hypothetical protein
MFTPALPYGESVQTLRTLAGGSHKTRDGHNRPKIGNAACHVGDREMVAHGAPETNLFGKIDPDRSATDRIAV